MNDTSIVPQSPTVNELVKNADAFLQSVSNADEDALRNIFAQLAALKEALKAADKFREASVAYAQVARLTGLSTFQLYRLIRSGAIEARVPKGMSRGYRIRQSEVERFMATF